VDATLHNAGPSNVSDVELRYVKQPGFKFVSTAGPCNGRGNNEITCHIPIDAGQRVTTTFIFTLDAEYWHQVCPQIPSAKLVHYVTASTQANPPDPDHGNDSVYLYQDMACPPDFRPQ